jgi:hypothetical protein
MMMAVGSRKLTMVAQPRRQWSSKSPFLELKSCNCRKEFKVDNKALNGFLKELYKYNILDYKYSKYFTHQWFTNYGTQTPIIFAFLLHTYIHIYGTYIPWIHKCIIQRQKDVE